MPTEFEYELAENVRRGIAFMEQKYGDTWIDHFDEGLKRFNIQEGACCVLGTVWNKTHNPGDMFNDGYHRACEELGWDTTGKEVQNHGFYLDTDCIDDGEEAWNKLQAVWKRALRRRKNLRAKQLAG